MDWSNGLWHWWEIILGFVQPTPMGPTPEPQAPSATQAPGPGLGDPSFNWLSGSDLLADCDATLEISYNDRATTFKACMSVFDVDGYCNFLGYVECRPVHVPVSATGWCPGTVRTNDFQVGISLNIDAIKMDSFLHRSCFCLTMTMTCQVLEDMLSTQMKLQLTQSILQLAIMPSQTS